MIDVKNAVQRAREEAAVVLGAAQCNLEEIEREVYNGHEIWSITLSLPRNFDLLPPLAQLSTSALQYKRFLIDAETGELVAMKIRELASR